MTLLISFFIANSKRVASRTGSRWRISEDSQPTELVSGEEAI